MFAVGEVVYESEPTMHEHESSALRIHVGGPTR